MSAVEENEEDILNFNDLMSALKKGLDSSQLKIINFSTTKFSLLGESFCSTLVRVNVTIRKDENTKDESLHLIMKKIYSVKSFVEWSVAFKKEVLMYTDLMPAYRSLERESGIKENEIINVVPNYFGHQNSRNVNVEVIDEHSLLLLDDLNFRDYYVCDRLTGMDLKHAKKAIFALSRYHALGIVLKHKSPVYFQTIVDQIQVTGLNGAQIKGIYRNLYKTLKDQPQINQHFSKIEPCFVRRPSKNSPWFCVTHGDFRLNNMLFHKDNTGDIDDVKIIDFQVCNYDSPFKDVIYFCNTSLDDETLENHLDDLLDVYYESLTSWLSCFGHNMELFSKADFERELKEQAPFEFPQSVAACKFVLHRNMDETKDSCHLIDIVLQSDCNEAYVKKVLIIIRNYDKKGWF